VVELTCLGQRKQFSPQNVSWCVDIYFPACMDCSLTTDIITEYRIMVNHMLLSFSCYLWDPAYDYTDLNRVMLVCFFISRLHSMKKLTLK
jgi:hypothetical protein